MKKFELNIIIKDVCNYEGGKEAPLDNSVLNQWSVGIDIKHIIECEKLTAEVITKELKGIIFNETDIDTNELFATESHLQYSRIEDNESNHLTGVIDYDAFYVTYIMSVSEIIDINCTQIDGITEY